jgi:hypothetical protein
MRAEQELAVEVAHVDGVHVDDVDALDPRQGCARRAAGGGWTAGAREGSADEREI